MCCYITLYYSTIIAYAVFYLFASFRDEMPWSKCNNLWNTANCFERTVNASETLKQVKLSNLTSNRLDGSVSPAEEYFNRYMLKKHLSTGIDDLGPIKIDLGLCLAAVYLVMYLCIRNGVKSTGKAVYITATLPYIILIMLLFHGLTLEGSYNGVSYFLVPTFSKLYDYECWKDAAIQIFFTLGPGK